MQYSILNLQEQLAGKIQSEFQLKAKYDYETKSILKLQLELNEIDNQIVENSYYRCY